MRRRWLAVFALLFLAFLYAPLAVIVGYSFNANPVNMLVWDGFTLDWYKGILGLAERNLDAAERAIYIESTPQMLAALRNSLVVAGATTMIATTLGTCAALALRARVRGRNAIAGAMMLPALMPDIVLGVGLLLFFSTIGITLSLLTIVIGQSTFLTAYVFAVVRARLARLDPALEEASADLGAGPLATFRRITLPQLAPGLAGGALLAFIISMDDLVITYFIAGPGSQTLPVFIFGMIRRGVKPEINAIATLIILTSALVAALGYWLFTRGERR